MRHPEPRTPTPEPFVPENSAPALESVKSVDTKSKTPKVKNLPTQAEEQERRKLVNDQQLLEQLRSKLNIHSIQSESALNSEPEPALKSEPEPEPNPNSESEPSALNHASDGAEPMTSAPLLFLPAKIKSAEVHFMIDSSATNNFLSHNLVH